jgi:hypothetical protein
MSLLPVAASLTLRFISPVVAVCSSTAEAMVVWKSLIRAMTLEISSIAVTAPVVSPWMASTRLAPARSQPGLKSSSIPARISVRLRPQRARASSSPRCPRRTT